jgi:hypothetical protein
MPKKNARFTKEPGRQIYLDGKPFIGVTREGDVNPWIANDFTDAIVKLLNKGNPEIKELLGLRLYRNAPFVKKEAQSTEPSADDLEEFRNYCKLLASVQLRGVYENEISQGRKSYALIAQSEAEARGVEVK